MAEPKYHRDHQDRLIRWLGHPLDIDHCQHQIILPEGLSIMGMELFCGQCGLMQTITYQDMERLFREKVQQEG